MGNLVEIVGTQVRVNTNTLAEAKLAIKELKLRKKEYALQKRSVNEQMKAIRAQYTEDVRTRGSKAQRVGSLSKFFRTVQTISRDNHRAKLASDLAPYERKKQEIESMMIAIDSVIIKLEIAVINNNVVLP